LVDEQFMNLQKELFVAQLKLAVKYKKSVIVHNREAKGDMLPLLEDNWNSHFEGRIVFHCCEPDKKLLEFAKEHKMFIGVDGDVTYREDKQQFIKTVPLDMLVLETDSPFLLPEPLRTQKKYPNTPANLLLIAEFISQVRGENIEDFIQKTSQNAEMLFRLRS
jgi:TatD DNase family protein